MEHHDISRAIGIYQRDSNWYDRRDLYPSERALLWRLRHRWPTISMLDLGIGVGRTTWTFAAVAGRYVGIDLASEMVDSARAMVGDHPDVQLMVHDARELGALGSGFDVVLFSMGGIDTMVHEDRLRVLDESRAVLNKGGWFLFSTHSFQALQHYSPLASAPRELSPKALYQWAVAARSGLRLARRRRALDLSKAMAQGWAWLPDGAHDFDLDLYWVDAGEQRRQLEAARFELVEVSDSKGSPVAPETVERGLLLHWLARAV